MEPKNQNIKNQQNNYTQEEKNINYSNQNITEINIKNSSSLEKANDNNIFHFQKLKEYIDNIDETNLINFLTKENLSESLLNKGLCLSLQKYPLKMEGIISLLLYKGANPDSYFQYIDKSNTLEIDENDKFTCIMYACFKGYFQLLFLLMKGKYNINLRDKNGKNALFYVLNNKNDNFIIVDYLIKEGININCEGKFYDKNGYIIHIPLSYAVINNLKLCVKTLLENGANPNFKILPNEDSILHISVRNGNLDIVKELISVKGIKLEEKNKMGQTPRDIAINCNFNEIYKILTEKINEVNIIESQNVNLRFKEKYLSNIKKESNEKNIEKNNNNIINDVSNKSKKINSRISKILDLFPNYKNNKNIYFKPRYNNLSSSFQIPIKFNNNINKFDTTYNSYFSIDNSNNPILTLDFSQNKLDYEIKIAQLTQEIKEIREIRENYMNENTNLKNDLEKMNLKRIKLTEKLNEFEKKFTEQIEEYKKENEELKNKLNQSQKDYFELLEKYNQNSDNQISNQINQYNPTQYNLYLNKKFINFTYDHIYVLNCLSKDIKDYQQFVKIHIEREQNLYDTLIKNIQLSVNETIQNYEVHLYGSHATNLCLPWSDLDVVLVSINNSNNNQNLNVNNQILLNQLYENLKKKEWVKESKYISGASIPIIKIISDKNFNNMQIDISIQDEKHFGLKCVDLVKKFISQYESLKPLVLVLKNILKRANLNDPYKGGISSYGLILMIVTFLQTQKKIGKDISNNENNLGRLFYDFVNHYGIKFEPSKYIIYARINEDDEKDDLNIQNIQVGSDLVIIDPLNISNNVAKSCFQFFNVKMSLIICIITLKEDCECGCHYNGNGEAYNNLNADHCFLKRIFNSVQRFQI